MTVHETHRSHRIGWLRASVLGANDGIVSTSSLIIGVASANTGQSEILLAGLAGLVAGAMSSQSDTENADLELERKSLQENLEYERAELAEIYEHRGLAPELASQVAEQLMAHDALGAHARDEIGITDGARARPVQAALSSALTFTIGAALPLSIAWVTSPALLVSSVALFSLLFLSVLGGIAARAGGAPMLRASVRVTFWGALAMMLTAGVGRLFGIAT